MPTITTSLIPTINPGSLLSRLVSDNTISVRFYTAKDPVYYEVLSRPIADLALRQLIIAKAVDNIQLRLGYQNLFPFLVQPTVVNGTAQLDLPGSWIWAMHVSLPAKWEKIRLAKIKRISGDNASTGGTGEDYTGSLRLVFSGQEEGSTTEVALFEADYDIDSTLDYQVVRVSKTLAGESNPIASSERETVDGFVTFRTLDRDDATVQELLAFLDPPLTPSDADSDGEFDSPAVYQILDETDTTRYTLVGLSHGTGLLVDPATSPIPPVESSVENWVDSFNYPFDDEAALLSATHTSITIPTGLFKQFLISVPAGDEPDGDLSGEFFPVYVSKIVREDDTGDTISFRFSTYNVEAPSTSPVEFAKLTLERDMESGQRVKIEPIENLFPSHAGEDNWMQGFGRGHVVLSGKWGSTESVIEEFFDAVAAIPDDPPEALFTKDSTRLSSFGLHSAPQSVPTDGQAAALVGSRDGVENEDPSGTNRFVVEADQGLGTRIDFLDGSHDLSALDGANRYGYTGGLCHRVIYFELDASKSYDYTTEILPRLVILLGRNPAFGDMWHDGVRVKFFGPNGTWQTF
jgi:hypothetical protein